MKFRLLVFFFLIGSALAQTQSPAPSTPPDSTKLEIVSAPKAFLPLEVDPRTVNADVLVKLQVTETGEVADAEIVSGDPVLQERALTNAKQWKFKPFIRNGVAIPVNTTVHISFQPTQVRVSQKVMEAFIAKKVQPTYPPYARAAHIQGSVVMRVLIGMDGNLKELALISGHPMLAPAALDAVRRWSFKPYYLNGKPVDLDSQITINFQLGH